MRFNLTDRCRTAALLAVAVVLTTATPALAQIGGIGPGLPGLPGGAPGLPSTADLPPRELQDLTRGVAGEVLSAPERLEDLIRRSDGALEADPQGWPVVRSEILAVDLSAAARAWALAEGYTVLREERLEALDMTTTILAPPRRAPLRRAVDRLRQEAPEASVEYNHVYAPAGAAVFEGEAGGAAASLQSGGEARLGLIDTGIDSHHPAFAAGAITQRGFAGQAIVGAHGTAVASLMVGRTSGFSGAWPGAPLLVADLYGGRVSSGSSTGLAQALNWMVVEGATVVNISLVGPRNQIVQRAVERAQARGLTLVAAVGNDGPAAAPLFPASYPRVIGVSAVGGSSRVLPEAARGAQVDYAAPGADMAAASPGSGYTSVRGTSFAAPIVAGLLARQGGVSALTRSARDLGDSGPDYIYGAGLVGSDIRVAPRAVGARGRLD